MPAFAQTQKRKQPLSAARVTAVRRDLRLARTLASQKLQPTIAQKLQPSILPESSALVIPLCFQDETNCGTVAA